ncbi:unnamed protein product [Brassicogethes aeneus]|uniref:Uncharacterized protein n=1 Tax=Brassicogethes aeneus TaxID=1431903 RepID=A0A9P0B9Y6_BRAAE|nr:unnamed protein product [Brassicogethes aeneus]
MFGDHQSQNSIHNGVEYLEINKMCDDGEYRIKNMEDSSQDIKETETTSQPKLLIFLSEFFATALLIFMICMGCTMQIDATVLQNCLTSGFIVMILVHTFGPISGAHLNPVVTISYMIINRLSLKETFVYFIAQFLGALTGYGLLMVITPLKYYDVPGHCMTLPNPELETWQAVTCEFLLTFVLIVAACATWDTRNENSLDSVSIRFGLLIAALSIIGSPYTGTSMNPARSFGPALWKGDMRSQWIYWIGPTLGSVVGSYVYKLLFLKEAINP